MLSRWLILGALILACILVPFALFEDPVTKWVTAFLAQPHAPWILGFAIAALLAADVLLPVPSSVISIGAGALLGFSGGLAASTAGMTLGCIVGYWLGLRGARRPAERLLGSGEMAKLERAHTLFGEWIVLLLRPVPVLAEASVVFAGMGNMRFPRFLAMTALANLLISAGYAWMGAFVESSRH